MKFKDELNLGFIYMGTLVGAGFASGQEIMKFFTVYGKQGLVGIIVSCMLFFIIGYLVLFYSIQRQSTCVRDIMLPLCGKKLMTFFELFVTVFLLGGYYIMVSGCGAVLLEGFDLPYYPSVGLICLICIWGLKNGIEGLANFNKIAVPLMIFLTLVICKKTIPNFEELKLIIDFAPEGSKGFLFSAFVYVSFNMVSGSVVLASLGKSSNRPKAALGGAFIAACGLFVMGSAVWLMTTANFYEIVNVQIPLMWIAKPLGQSIYFMSVVILLLAMLTTAFGMGFAFLLNMSIRFKVRYEHTLFMLIIGIPLTACGFSNMVGLIYPIFGIVGILFILLIIFRRFFLTKIE